ncbi:hypothetical protein [Streptomyces sp. Ru73]|nr:hypothetical protein [Streptomyces sp. Ru73]
MRYDEIGRGAPIPRWETRLRTTLLTFTLLTAAVVAAWLVAH